YKRIRVQGPTAYAEWIETFFDPQRNTWEYSHAGISDRAQTSIPTAACCLSK
ncbi:MAG: hypothetical protein ACI9C3_001015, partial [Yoonia sp.]